ncbi:MAG: tetratricopeptide repeat protein, partial [Planctomycetota bacterium]
EGGVGGIPLPTRLDLVARVADAVAAAHSVVVLYKDLKPDNILIYLSEEGLPRPQLSDFGIGRVVDYAKIKGDGINLSGVDSALLDDSDETHTGTLIYAPPETLAGKPFTIQGDVYELGILLYQMVVGDLERPLAHGWERNVPDALLRGDIAECVAGDELMRLASAKELAERLRTLPKRRRAARRKHVTRLTALSTVLLAALLTIVTAYLWQERTLRLRAEVAEQQAKNEESKAKAINAFILRALGSADPTKDGFDVTVAEVLSDAASEINTSFPDQPLVRAELRNTIGKTLKELGLFNEAAQQHRLALEVRREEFPPGSPEIAESLKELADALWFDGNYEEAEPLYRESLELRKAEYGEESAEYAEILNNLAACLQGLDRHDEAVRSYEESLAIRRRVLEGEARHLVAAGLNNLGMCLSAQGKYDDAEERYREALDVITEVKGEDHFGVGVTMTNLASCLVEQGSYDEAERLYERAMEIKVERAGPDHHRVAVVLNGLAKLHLRQDALEEAEGFSREALDVLVRGELRRTHERYGDTLTLMGDILIHGGKAEEAESSIREALDIRRNARPQIEWKIAETESILGECLSELGEYDEAERLLERSFPAIEKHHGLAHGATQRAIDRMIAHYRATGQQDQMQRYVAMRNGGRGG